MPLKIVFILGSAPHATELRDKELGFCSALIAINNAWQVRNDWTHLIHPDDFDKNRLPIPSGNQKIIKSKDYVPANNAYGGVIYCGGTMAFSAGYWALNEFKPDILAFFGCDMIYNKSAQNHFYGLGTPDPLRDDPTLQSLEAKSNRLLLMAAKSGCLCLNISKQTESRLTFPKTSLAELAQTQISFHANQMKAMAPLVQSFRFLKAAEKETKANCFVESGDYWSQPEKLDYAMLNQIDQLWLESLQQGDD